MPPCGGAHEALRALRRAGEGAFLVPEELALHQLRRQGAAVDDHEGLLRPRAVLVHRARDHLLARPALARDEHARARARDAADHLHDRLHRLALADDGSAAEGLPERLAERAVLVDDPPLLERLVEEREQLVVAKGLEHEVVRAAPHGLDRVLRAPVGGDHQDLDRRIPGERPAEHLHARSVGEREIGDHRVVARVRLVQPLEGLRPRLGRRHAVPGPREQDLEHLAQAGFVVTYEDPRAHRTRGYRMRSVRTRCGDPGRAAPSPRGR